MQKKGLTLLELIVVIIVIGVVASLALPRFFRLVEFSKSVGSIQSIGTIRDSMERCYMATSDYGQCRLNSPGPAPDSLDIENPENAFNAHFGYKVNVAGAPFNYRVTATRNTFDGGTAGDTIIFSYRQDGTVTRAGTGAFSGIK